MADLSMVFDLLARDRASAEVSKVGDSMKRTGDQADRTGNLIKKGLGMAAGALAVGALTSTFTGLYEAAAESAKVAARTANVIKTTGSAAGISAAQVGDLATSISNKTGVDDEAIQSASNLLLTFTNVRNEAGKGNAIFSRTTQLAVDMGAAMGKDASGAAMQLGKALNDPVKGISALSRSGVSFTAQQKEQIKTLVASGDTLGAQRIILNEVGKEFGGAAAAAATPMDRLKVTAGNLQEQIGTGLIPVFDKVAGAASQAIGILFGGEDTGGPFAAGSAVTQGLFSLRDAAIDLGHWLRDDLWPALQDVFGFLSQHQTTVTVIAALISGVLVAAFTVWGARAIIAAGQNALAWLSVVTSSGTGAAATQRSALQVVARWVFMGARAVLQGLKIAAVWTVQIVGAAVRGAAAFAVQAARVAGRWAFMAAQAVIQGGKQAAVWTAQVVAGAARGAAAFAVEAGRVVGRWAFMAAQSLIQAGRMAGAWFIALGPIGWITAAVIGIAILIAANWDKVVAFTKAAFAAVWGAVKAAVAFIVKIFLNFTVVGLIIKHWATIKATFAAGVQAIVGFVTGIPGKIAGLATSLYNTGRDMIQGLINGAQSLLKNIGKFFLDLVPGWIRGPFEKALGIASPSKVFHRYGVDIGQGLIKGLTGSSKDVQAASAALAKKLQSAYDKASKKGGNKRVAARALAGLHTLAAGDDALVRMAKRRDTIAKQLEKARDRLSDAVKMRQDFAGSVADSARQFASITDIKTAGSPAVLVDDLRARLDAITTFRGQLAQLARAGVRDDVYQQIVSAGVEAGGATAEALLAGGPQTIAEVNRLQAGIAAASSGLGNDAARRLYQAGVDAAQGLVDGLVAKSKGLAAAANTLARTLTAAVKKRLGIKSPSTVFEGIGVNIGQGLADGIAAMRPVVASELAALADLQTVQTLQAVQTLQSGAGVDLGGGTAPGYRPPAYDTTAVGAAAPAPAPARTVNISGVASPEVVAAVVRRDQAVDEFLAGAR